MTGGRPTRPLPSLLFRRIRALVLLTLVITVISVTVHLVRGGPDDASAVGSNAEPVPVAPVPPPTSESASAELSQTLAQRNSGVRGRLSVAVTDLGTGVTASYGAPERTFVTGSIVKVDILATLLLQRKGELTKSQKVAAKRMIQNSDNGAATTLWRQIGQAKGLHAANQTFGMTSTVGGRGGRWGTTTTTAADQLQLLRVVFAQESPLNATSRTYLKSLMGSVAADQDWGVSAADTRSGEKYYVKNGWLPYGKGWVVNSVGSVEHKGHVLLIVALSDGRPGKSTGVEVLEGASRDTARAVTGS